MLIPRTYQQEGIDFLRRKKKSMLADAPGTGKSFQASEAFSQLKPVLVSAPTYLTEQWYDFLTDQYGDEVALADGPRKEREQELKRKVDWYIINHQMLRNGEKHKGFELPEVQSVILDESHHLRGRHAQQHEGALSLAKQVEYVAELTATPVQRELDDFWGQLVLLDPDDHWLKSYWRFRQHFFRPVERMGRIILEARPHFKKFLEQYKLERSYEDVGLYLPPLISEVVPVRLSKAVANMYRQIRNEYRAGDITFDSAAQVLHVLRGLTACTEKLEATVSLATEFPSYCIFTWYRNSAIELGARLEVPVIIGTGAGSTAPNERRIIARQNDRIVADIQALSEGVDLSHIRTVIFFEEDYTPGGMYQALSRLRRWNKEESSDPILCYYMLARDTIDETVHRIQSHRAFTVRDLVKMELAR